MENFIWWITVLIGLECAAKIVGLVIGRIPARTPIGVGLDLVVGIGFMVWGIVLLST